VEDDVESLDLVVELLDESDGARPGDADLAQRVLQRAVEVERSALPASPTTVYVSLVLTDDAGIARLNRQYRGIDTPTDVLSFPQLDAPGPSVEQPAGMPLMLGDIVISLLRAEEQAREYGHSRERELAFLLVHGLLHLLGFDHEMPEQAAAMETEQDVILQSLGLSRDSPA
jgi:probable rRNA maturation factor